MAPAPSDTFERLFPQPCRFCGAAGARLAFVKDDYAIAECPRCGTAFVANPPPFEELASFYNREYYEAGGKRGYSDYMAKEKSKRKEARRELEWIERHRGPGVEGAKGRLLDVGCAAGFFVAEAADRGWDACGIDVSQYAIDYAQSRLGLRSVRCATLEAGLFEARSFDVICLWDSIEHLPAPAETLAEAARLLRPGGLLALATGDWRSWGARWGRGEWRLMGPPSHLFYFTTRALLERLTALGLTPVARKTNDRVSESWPWRTKCVRRWVRRWGKGDVVTLLARKDATSNG